MDDEFFKMIEEELSRGWHISLGREVAELSDDELADLMVQMGIYLDKLIVHVADHHQMAKSEVDKYDDTWAYLYINHTTALLRAMSMITQINLAVLNSHSPH